MNDQKIPKLRFPEFNSQWNNELLGELVEVSTGNKDTKDKDPNGKYPFFVRSDNVERIDSYSYDGEAILTSGDGVGVGENFHYINGKFDYHQRVYCLYDFIDEVVGEYIYHYFSKAFYKRVMRLSAKNSVDSVRMNMITKMPIKLPSKGEQKRISSFLSAIDKKIEQLKTKKELLEKYKKGVMQKLFSQKVRFKDKDGNKYPDWEEKTFGEVFERVTRKNEEDNQNVLTISAQDGLINQEEYFNRSVASKDLTGYYLLKRGEFAYNKSYSNGYPLGAIKRLNRYDKGVVSTLYICFKIKPNNSPEFYEEFLEYGGIDHEIYKIAHEGSRNHGLLNVSVIDFFKDIKIPRLSLEEQERIAEFLSAISKKQKALKNKLDKVQEFKKGLLQQMLV